MKANLREDWKSEHAVTIMMSWDDAQRIRTYLRRIEETNEANVRLLKKATNYDEPHVNFVIKEDFVAKQRLEQVLKEVTDCQFSSGDTAEY